MNYGKIYHQLMERGKGRKLLGYFEWHHILPRSLGGADHCSNLVALTYREHFLAHWLLLKIHRNGPGYRAMLYAFHCMSLVTDYRIIASWQFDIIKRARSDGFFDLAPDQRNRSITTTKKKKRKKNKDKINQQIANKKLWYNPHGAVVIEGRHYRLKEKNLHRSMLPYSQHHLTNAAREQSRKEREAILLRNQLIRQRYKDGCS